MPVSKWLCPSADALLMLFNYSRINGPARERWQPGRTSNWGSGIDTRSGRFINTPGSSPRRGRGSEDWPADRQTGVWGGGGWGGGLGGDGGKTFKMLLMACKITLPASEWPSACCAEARVNKSIQGYGLLCQHTLVHTQAQAQVGAGRDTLTHIHACRHAHPLCLRPSLSLSFY